ncbi:NADH-quinone oxidoreductase subunit L [Reichenbachiella sp. MALMAid0571]|uniref:NADH-quinone oxidoreductase subunit L n=1 Tax=Reichenbachiella sp. MALMAid0571 TaxID=3143939 RepID=UPI0032DEE11A
MIVIETVHIDQMWLVFLIPMLPLLAFLVAVFLKNKDFAALFSTVVSAAVFFVAVEVIISHYGSALYYSMPWFTVGKFTYNVGILLDKLSLVMIGVVSLIALLVNVFSLEYMKHDEAKGRYFSFLGLFAFSMYGIVLSSNLFLTFVFWELVGFSSYLLIGFWFQNEEPPKASFKAFIVNRVGDAGFLIGLFVVFVFFHSFELPYLWNEFSEFGKPDASIGISKGWLMVMGLGLFLGAMGKSAQFPLQTWLPDAMAGPTPVSALIHAATMVAAGVFMLVRVFPLLSIPVLDVIAIIGALTAFMGAFAAFSQNDIKKVLAFSTVSQLGYMVMSIGVGSPDAAFFHLVTHAFFKASLFLCAGSVIHYLHHENDPQNMYKMGGLRKYIPFTFIAYTISMLALCGLPFFSGYFSKEAILSGVLEWITYSSMGGIGWKVLVPLFAFISVFMTAAYMGRQYFLVFFGKPKWTARKQKESWYVAIPILLLASLSFWFVYSLSPFHADTFLLEILRYKGSVGSEHLINPVILGMVSSSLAILGLFVSYLLFYKKKAQHFLNKIHELLGGLSASNWYLDGVHSILIVQPVMKLRMYVSHFDRKYVDGLVNGIGVLNVVVSQILGWFDKYMVDGVIKLITVISGNLGNVARSFQNGRIQMYFVWAVLGIVLVLIVLF